jgi:hypothetical protein
MNKISTFHLFRQELVLFSTKNYNLAFSSTSELVGSSHITQCDPLMTANGWIQHNSFPRSRHDYRRTTSPPPPPSAATTADVVRSGRSSPPLSPFSGDGPSRHSVVLNHKNDRQEQLDFLRNLLTFINFLFIFGTLKYRTYRK